MMVPCGGEVDGGAGSREGRGKGLEAWNSAGGLAWPPGVAAQAR